MVPTAQVQLLPSLEESVMVLPVMLVLIPLPFILASSVMAVVPALPTVMVMALVYLPRVLPITPPSDAAALEGHCPLSAKNSESGVLPEPSRLTASDTC